MRSISKCHVVTLAAVVASIATGCEGSVPPDPHHGAFAADETRPAVSACSGSSEGDDCSFDYSPSIHAVGTCVPIPWAGDEPLYCKSIACTDDCYDSCDANCDCTEPRSGALCGSSGVCCDSAGSFGCFEASECGAPPPPPPPPECYRPEDCEYVPASTCRYRTCIDGVCGEGTYSDCFGPCDGAGTACYQGTCMDYTALWAAVDQAAGECYQSTHEVQFDRCTVAQQKPNGTACSIGVCQNGVCVPNSGSGSGSGS